MNIKYNLFLGYGLFMLIFGMGPSGGSLAASVAPGVTLAAGQTLTRNNGSEPASLDPHKSESDVEFNIINDFFEGLVTMGPDGHIRPGLAERWENSEDGRIWRLYLRPGLQWSNGSP